tara:strand:- start:5735 stop:7504 length:1770 start_codon:yes stop_codon:yes gene_type:complete
MSIFDGSRFGDVAGSLLARRRKVSSRDRNEALVLSALLAGFTGKQQSLQEDLTNNLTDLQSQYQDIFQTNRDIFNSQENIKARAEFKQYQTDPTAYLDFKAKELFDADLNMQNALGTNPSATLAGTRDLTNDSIDEYRRIMAEKRQLAEQFILAKSQNPAITMPTFSQYNAAAKAEYLAARNQLRDDPTKKSVLANIFNGIFGTGASTKIELEEKLEESRLTREAQDNLVTENDALVGSVMSRNRAIINAKARVTNSLGFDTFSTDEQVFADKQKELQRYFRNPTNPVTAEKLTEAIANGVTIDKFPGLKTLQSSDVPSFAATFTKAEQLLKRGITDPTDYYTLKERDIWDSVFNIDRNEIDVQKELESKENRIDVIGKVQEVIATADAETRDLLFNLSGDFATDGSVDNSTFESYKFVSNVIRGATKYQNKYDLNKQEAYEQAFEDQLLGISIGTERQREHPEYMEKGAQQNPQGFENVGEWFDEITRIFTIKSRTNGSEYVNPDVLKIDLVPETADQFAENWNDNEWYQYNSDKYIDSGGREQNLVPQKGKERIVRKLKDNGELDFEIVFQTRPSGNGNEYEWYVAD